MSSHREAPGISRDPVAGSTGVHVFVDGQQFASRVAHPGLVALLPVLYPGDFPSLAALSKKGTGRTDLEAVLLTGLPEGVVPGFQNDTGAAQADMLRLTVAIKPARKPSMHGILGGDLAGFPNGRRVFDDAVAIEPGALAGATYGLVDKTGTADAAASAVTDGLTPDDLGIPYLFDVPYLTLDVPYLTEFRSPGVPHSGFTAA